jgi:hypothetical protein
MPEIPWLKLVPPPLQEKAQSPARAFGEAFLGRLQRMDNGSSTPLTGENLRDWKPRGILVAHLHEHHGLVSCPNKRFPFIYLSIYLFMLCRQDR